MRPSWWRHGGEPGVEGRGRVQREGRAPAAAWWRSAQAGPHSGARSGSFPVAPCIYPCSLPRCVLLAVCLLATLGCACIDVYVLPCAAGKVNLSTSLSLSSEPGLRWQLPVLGALQR